MDNDNHLNSVLCPNDRLNARTSNMVGAEGTNFSVRAVSANDQRRKSASHRMKREKPPQGRLRSGSAQYKQDPEKSRESRTLTGIELTDIIPVIHNMNSRENEQSSLDRRQNRQNRLSTSPARSNKTPQAAQIKKRSSRQLENSRETSDRGLGQSHQKSGRTMRLKASATLDNGVLDRDHSKLMQLERSGIESGDSNSKDQLAQAVKELELHCQIDDDGQQPPVIEHQNYHPQLIQIQHTSMNESMREELVRSERTLQLQQHEQVSRQDRRRIMQYSLARVVVHCVITITLFALVKRGENDAKGCSKDVHKYLEYCAGYFGLCCLRQFIVCLLIPCTKQPQRLRDLANVVFIAIDIFLFTCLTVFGTKIMFADDTKACRQGEDGSNLLMMWIFSFCCLIYGWIYCGLLCCGLTTFPLILIFWCVYRMQMNEISREESPDHQSPGNAKRVIKSLNKEKFCSTTHTADCCIICLEKFKEDDTISELPCDGRHMFHFHCLEQWLHNKLICPLCKQNVRPRQRRGMMGRAWDYITRGRRNPNNGEDDTTVSPARSGTDAHLNGLAQVSEPINRAFNDPMNIAVDLGLNSEIDPPFSNQAIRQPPRDSHRSREDAPVSQQELRQICLQLQRQQEQIEEQKMQIAMLQHTRGVTIER